MSDYVCPVAVFSASTRFEIRAPEPNLRLPETPDSRVISVQIATQHVRWQQSSLQFRMWQYQLGKWRTIRTDRELLLGHS
jgi:hypothetical protein